MNHRCDSSDHIILPNPHCECRHSRAREETAQSLRVQRFSPGAQEKNFDHVMDFETASKCCTAACRDSAPGNSSVIREVNTPSAGQATRMDLRATCLPGRLHEQENEDANMMRYNVMSPDGRKCDVVGWGRVTPPAEEEECNSSEKSDSSGCSGNKSMAYINRETQRVGLVDDLTEEAARSPFSEARDQSPGSARATKMMQALTPTEDFKAPGLRSTGIESENPLSIGTLEGRESEGSAAISSSIVWTEFLNVSIPANMRAYEELFRCCVSPAASASPTSTRKTGSPTGPRKSSAGTDQGTASLSRFETLSTQPSHPRLYADDAADDSSPSLVPGAPAPTASIREPEDGLHHSDVCVGDEGNTGELGAASVRITTEAVVDPLGQQQTEQVANDIPAGKAEVMESDGVRECTRRCSRNSDATNFAGSAEVPNTEERTGCSSLHGMTRNSQDYTAPAEGDIPASMPLPFDAATSPAPAEPGRAAQCTFMAQAASGTSGEDDVMQGNVDGTARAKLEGGAAERSIAGTSPTCGGPPALIKQASRVLSPTPQTAAKAVQFDSTTGACNDAVVCSTTPCVAPAATEPEESASVEVATHEVGGEEQTAQAEERAVYPPASDLAATRCSAEEAAVTNRDDLGMSAVTDARRNDTAASITDANRADSLVSRNTTVSSENRVLRAGVVAGEGAPPVGPRGRPSLGAAGRQLLLDHIRAKYHTNVGLYSGVLRKNYNSTISKLPFFTVSLLHQLAADFGIDTNAVLEQQQQQHYDSARGSSTRHNTETGYPTGGRGARQGTYMGAAHAREASGNGGAFYVRNPAADRRMLTGGSQGASPYSTVADKRKGRLHYESLTRRRCTRRGTKKNGGAADGALGSLPGETGESVCPVRGARRRSVGIRTSRASWESEVADSSPRHTQHQHHEEDYFMRGNMGTQGCTGNPEQDTQRQQRKSGKEHEQINFEEYAGGTVVSCIKEEAAPEGEAWTEDQALRAELSSISTASATVVRARAVAIEKRREEPGQQSAAAHGEPHCNSRSTCTAAIELLGSSIERAPGDTLSEAKWRTVADVRLLVREQGRDQHRLLSSLGNMEEGEENEGGKSVGDVCALRSRPLEGMPLISKNEHTKWHSGITPYNRLPAAESFREPQQHAAVETYAGALSYLRRPPAGDAAINMWSRDGRINNVGTIGETKEKRRNNSRSHGPFASGGSGGVICGSAVGDGDTLKTQTILKENVSVCELPHARYLWSVLFGQLPEESGRALHSAVAGQDPCRTPAGRAKCEEVGREYRAGYEKCLPHTDTADMPQHLPLVSTDRREVHASTDLHLSIPQPDEILAAVSTAGAGSGARNMGEGVPLCRGREWVPRLGPANNKNSYGQNATEGVAGAFAAVSGSDTGVVAARMSDVERHLDVDGRAVETEHLRKRLKMEVPWSQREGEVHKSRPVLQSHPAPNSRGTRNYVPSGDLQESSVWHGDRRSIADDRILELLNRRGDEVPQGVGGPRGAETRDAANAGCLENTSTSTCKRGTADGKSIGDRIDCKPFTVAASASENLISGTRVRDAQGIQSCAEEPEGGWRESMHMQQESPFGVRANSNCSSDREPSTQTEERSTGGGALRVPFSSLTADEAACQRYLNGFSPPMFLQQEAQCRGKLSLASPCRKQPIPNAGGAGEHNGTLEGSFENPKCTPKRPLVEPWWPEAVDIKVGPDRPPPPASLAELSLTPSYTSGVSSSYRTSSPLTGYSVGQPASAVDVKQHTQQLQHERHPMMPYNRNKLSSLGGAKGRMHVSLETGEAEPSSQGWLPREAAEGDASKGPQPSYGKGTDPSVPDAATGFKSAARDTWSLSSATTQNTASGDMTSETMPLASLLLSSLLSEETTKPAGLNASASVGSRYTSRVVALLQTLSELQRKPASAHVLPQPTQQQNNRVGEGPAAEARHPSPSTSSVSTSPHPKEKLSSVQRVPNLNVPGILSTLLPALLDEADDRCGESGGMVMRQRADTSVQEQLLDRIQQRKHEVVDVTGGHGSWIKAKGGNDWTGGTQEDPGPRGINSYGAGETSAPNCLRRPESADTPLALELVENFLKAQGLSSSCSSYRSDRRPSLPNTSQDGSPGRHDDRSGRQSSVPVDNQGTTETSIPRKAPGTNNLREAGSTSGTEDPPVGSHTDDKRVHIVKDELGSRHELYELQSPYARYCTLHGS